MDNFKRLRWQVRVSILSILIIEVLLVAGIWITCKLFGLNDLLSGLAAMGSGILLGFLAVEVLTDIALNPIRDVWQGMLHIDAHHESVLAPNPDKLRFGRELVSGMLQRIYQYASQQDGTDLIQHRKDVIQASSIVSHMPLPLFVFNKQLLVTNASDNAIKYCGVETSDLFGKPIFDSLNLEFQNNETLEKWIVDCQKSKVTDTGYWEKVRVVLSDGTHHQFDLAASYNRENAAGAEFIVTMFDRSKEYGDDDNALSFIALAVHELRTPLTMLRGYIEVFEDELSNTLDPELHDFMQKMQTSADQLTNFVHNILNVARVESNQLVLHLNEANWGKVLKTSCDTMELRASLNNVKLEYDIKPGLPTVGVDPVTIQEVLINLLDNSIKYSRDAPKKQVIISSKLNADGLVETTIQDFGVGIPESVLPNLFAKFYRNHRTKAKVGGTGLGLFLCKAIIDAHEGRIWAKSKEGEGTTIGFTLQPFDKLADERKSSGEIERQANGWIKNHSYYRS